jgi:hypothetical protein
MEGNMTNKVYRVFLEKLGGSDPTQFIGDSGELFYDPTTGALRISDGSVPGGTLLGALGSTGYVGSFYDTTTQTNPVANTVNLFTFNSTWIADGVQVVESSKLKVLHAGNWNIQFSAQVEKTDSGEDQIDIWLRKNGSDLAYTNTRVTVEGNNAKVVTAWNWVVTSVANDYFQIAWSSPDTDMRIYAEGTQINPTRPGIPSIIVTVSQV